MTYRRILFTFILAFSAFALQATALDNSPKMEAFKKVFAGGKAYYVRPSLADIHQSNTDATPNYGLVNVDNSPFVYNGTTQNEARAVIQFYNAPLSTGCVYVNESGCTYSFCKNTLPSPTNLVSAGDVSFVTSNFAKTFKFPYDFWGGTTSIWNVGDTLQVSALGDTVPAFTANVPTPGPVAFTSPQIDPTLNVDQSFTINRNSPLNFVWSHSSVLAAGTVNISIVNLIPSSDQSNTPSDGYPALDAFEQISCQYQSFEDGAVIAPNVLQYMHPGEPMTFPCFNGDQCMLGTALFINTQSEVDVTAGQWKVENSASTQVGTGFLPIN
jgi:hypothetical protein